MQNFINIYFTKRRILVVESRLECSVILKIKFHFRICVNSFLQKVEVQFSHRLQECEKNSFIASSLALETLQSWSKNAVNSIFAKIFHSVLMFEKKKLLVGTKI